MARQAFPYTTFTDPSGNVLSNGYILLELNEDVKSPSGSLCQGMTLRGTLDANGALVSVPQVWPNSQLSPSDSYYILRGFTSDGELVLGPLKVIVYQQISGFGIAFGDSFGS